jgi:hypothetical protein
MKPVIIAIAKLESSYIEEWVKYHILLGFDMIYLYDNEDQPTYQSLLSNYSYKVSVIHFPGKDFEIGVQYAALNHFVANYMRTNNITHVAHIDIDEFIVLKKHANIQDFITEFIKDDCAGIGINWRHFGSSGHTEKTEVPVTERFTMCQESGNSHIKTLFDIRYFIAWDSCHTIYVPWNVSIKSTNGQGIRGPFNDSIDFTVIQLNHYRSKTFPEYVYARSRQRADLFIQIPENVEETFKACDYNEIEELTACNFYKSQSKHVFPN